MSQVRKKRLIALAAATCSILATVLSFSAPNSKGGHPIQQGLQQAEQGQHASEASTGDTPLLSSRRATLGDGAPARTYPTTAVTALYNITAHLAGDGSPLASHMEWFQQTLLFEGPMVVYVSNDAHAQLVAQYREGLPTRVITRPLGDLKFANLTHYAAAVLPSDRWRGCASYPMQLEGHLEASLVVAFQRFVLLDEVAQANPYGSDFFIWMDPGQPPAAHSASNQLPACPVAASSCQTPAAS
jgi:hypothetical protein